MAQTPLMLANQGSQQAKGPVTWSDIYKIAGIRYDPVSHSPIADGAKDRSSPASTEAFTFKHVQLVRNGVILATDIGDSSTIIFTKNFGGATELFGQTLTGADVKRADFGVALAFGNTPTGADVTYFAIGTDFVFNLPDDAIIDGIQPQFQTVDNAGFAGPGTHQVELRKVSMIIYYTWAPKMRAIGESTGVLYSPSEHRVKPNKRLRHLIYDKNNIFVAEVTDKVVSEDSFRQDINNLHSSMDTVIEQNEVNDYQSVEILVTESDENILTEDDQDIIVDLASPAGVGPGTNLDVNYNLEAFSYWGMFVELLTEDDQPILTEDDQIIVVADGTPEGKRIFTGWMPDWELDFGEGDNVLTHWLTHSQELNNIMLETKDTPLIVSDAPYPDLGQALPLVAVTPSPYTSTPHKAAQVISAPSTADSSRVSVEAFNEYPGNSEVVMSIYQGTNPSSPGAFVGSVSTTAIYDPNNLSNIYGAAGNKQTLQFVLPDYINLVSATSYILYFESIGTTFTSSSPRQGVRLLPGSGYAGGNAWKYDDTSGWQDTGLGLLFTVWEAGGDTTVTFNSYDPSQMLRDALDFAQARGSRIRYTPESIPLSGILLSYTFRSNTINDVFEQVIKLLPADWYGYFDPGENMVHIQPRSSTVSHNYTKGRDVVKFKLKRSIREMVNDVYFTGGNNPALFVRTSDTNSQDEWRRGLAKRSDTRVTIEATAVAISQSEIDRNKDPIYAGRITAIPVDFEPEDVIVGELNGHTNFGPMIDALELQVVSKVYYPDKIEEDLGLLPPPMNRRVEEIKRDLDTLEQQYNPDSPA